MLNIIPETIEPALEFVRTIKPGQKVAIIHGHDNDSICSAAIIFKLLKNLYRIESKFVISGSNSSVTEDVLDTLKRIKPDHVIIVDISDVNVDAITEMRSMSRVMIIDHHVAKGYVKITYVNPRIYDKYSYLPATYICYKIYEKFLDTDEILWIAGVGTLSDMGLKNCGDLFDKLKITNSDLVGGNENVDEILFDNSVLGKLSKILDSGRVVKGIEGSMASLNAMIKSKDYQDILKGKSGAKSVLEYFEVAEKEFNRMVKDFEKNKKQNKKIILYEVKSKYNMKSPLASFLAKNLVNEILVIYQKKGSYVDVSFRRGRTSIADLNDIATNSVKDIPDSNGGGHIQAAGARFPSKYLPKFTKSLNSLT